MLYDLVNPSDTVSFRAPDRQVAALAVFLLSNGQYGADCHETEVKGDQDVPIFLLGGARSWWHGLWEKSIEETARERAEEVAAALETAAYVSTAARGDFEAESAACATEAERAAFIADWNAKHRGSTTAIVDAAHEIAANLRALAPS